MSKSYQNGSRSDVYALIRDADMSDSERSAALKAMQNAETIVDAFLWVQNKIAAVGNFFLHPSLKH